MLPFQLLLFAIFSFLIRTPFADDVIQERKTYGLIDSSCGHNTKQVDCFDLFYNIIKFPFEKLSLSNNVLLSCIRELRSNKNTENDLIRPKKVLVLSSI